MQHYCKGEILLFNCTLWIFICSGGHTTEILKLVAELSSRYQPRHYVVAVTDTMSIDKLHAMEKHRSQCKGESLVCSVCFFST